MRKGTGQVKSTTLYSPVLLSISQTFISKTCDIIIQGSEEIASGLCPLDCDCSASEDNTALGGIEETATFESCATPKISWRYVSRCLRINVCCLCAKDGSSR